MLKSIKLIVPTLCSLFSKYPSSAAFYGFFLISLCQVCEHFILIVQDSSRISMLSNQSGNSKKLSRRISKQLAERACGSTGMHLLLDNSIVYYPSLDIIIWKLLRKNLGPIIIWLCLVYCILSQFSFKIRNLSINKVYE